MKWADFQSVIQLIVALNTIYLSLKDIRAPVVRYEEEALLRLKSYMLSKNYNDIADDKRKIIFELEDEILVLIARFEEKKIEFEKKDSTLRKLSVFMAISYALIIVFSAFSAQKDISEGVAIVISTVGFIPLVWGLLLNIDLVIDLRQSVKSKRQRIEARFVEIKII